MDTTQYQHIQKKMERIISSRYDNGNVCREIWCDSNKVDECWVKCYYRNGQVKTESWMEWIDGEVGRPHGESWMYYKSGQKRLNWHSYHGKRQGPEISWHSNGEIYRSFWYNNNEKNGDFYKFFDDGRQAIEGHYKEGKRTSEWTYWWPPPTDQRRRQHMQQKGEYEYDKRVGQWEFFDRETGRRERVIPYVDGVEHGEGAHYLHDLINETQIVVVTYTHGVITNRQPITAEERTRPSTPKRPIDSKVLKLLKKGGHKPAKYKKLPKETMCALLMDEITSSYFKCTNSHPHYFDATQYTRYAKASGEVSCKCPLDKTYEINTQLYTIVK